MTSQKIYFILYFFKKKHLILNSTIKISFQIHSIAIWLFCKFY